MPASRYFEFHKDSGVAPDFVAGESGLALPNQSAGAPEAIASITIPVQIARKVGNDVIPDLVSVVVKPADKLDKHDTRIIPGTRFVETTNSAVAQVLLGRGDFVEIEQPSATDIKSAQKTLGESRQPTTTDAVQEA